MFGRHKSLLDEATFRVMESGARTNWLKKDGEWLFTLKSQPSSRIRELGHCTGRQLTGTKVATCRRHAGTGQARVSHPFVFSRYSLGLT